MNTRAIAAGILIRIRDEGAYSNVLLPQATKDLGGPDRAFVYRLVTSALRRIRQIDAIIEASTGRSLDQLDPEVSAILEIAIGELLTDDKGNAYATVNESVEATKQLDRPKASGLVNGVLRSLGRDGMAQLHPDIARDFSVPGWLWGALITDHGFAQATQLLEGLRTDAPSISVRLRPGGTLPEGAEPLAGIPDAYRLTKPPGPTSGVVFADGASTAVALALAPRSGEVVLDMAAAPGGKTMSLWDQTAGGATIIAMDSHRRRLQSTRRRLDAENVAPHWMIADGTSAPFRDGSVDAVLLDAPCSGVGTLRRRPEIAMRLDKRAPQRMAERQRKMLAEAWRVTRPGGRIVYSVCTILAAESVAVVADYPAVPPPGLPGRVWEKGRLLAPHLTETDGMFVAVIRKSS